jgi:hypothetical protein
VGVGRRAKWHVASGQVLVGAAGGVAASAADRGKVPGGLVLQPPADRCGSGRRLVVLASADRRVTAGGPIRVTAAGDRREAAALVSLAALANDMTRQLMH